MTALGRHRASLLVKVPVLAEADRPTFSMITPGRTFAFRNIYDSIFESR